MPWKRIILLLIIVTVLSCLTPPAVVILVTTQARRIIPESTLNIQGCELLPLGQVRFLNVRFQKDRSFDLKARDISVKYSLPSLFRKNILSLSLNHALLEMDLDGKDTLKLTPQPGQASSKGFTLDSLSLSNLQIKLKSKDINLESRIFMFMDLKTSSVKYMDMVFTASSKNFAVEDGSLKAGYGQMPGELTIKKIQYDKIVCTDITSGVRLTDNRLTLEPLTARTLNGTIQGKGSVRLDHPVSYETHLKFTNIDLSKFVEEFNLGKKCQLSGMLDGEAKLEGRGVNLEGIGGNFSVAKPGGVLIIKDVEFLENIARDSNQPMGIVVESFKDYRYDSGVIKLSLDRDDLVLAIAMAGETGKRDFKIVAHDFLHNPASAAGSRP